MNSNRGIYEGERRNPESGEKRASHRTDEESITRRQTDVSATTSMRMTRCPGEIRSARERGGPYSRRVYRDRSTRTRRRMRSNVFWFSSIRQITRKQAQPLVPSVKVTSEILGSVS